MKLCDRCALAGCHLRHLGPFCKSERQHWCPEVKPNRAELLSNMTLDEMATDLMPLMMDLMQDGVPSPEYMKEWLLNEPEGETLL